MTLEWSNPHRLSTCPPSVRARTAAREVLDLAHVAPAAGANARATQIGRVERKTLDASLLPFDPRVRA